MNEACQRILDALRTDGIALARFPELFGEELWREAQADIEPFVRGSAEATQGREVAAGKDDIVVRRFYDVPGMKKRGYVLAPSAPWFRIAASDTVLDIVNAYRGEWTKLYYVDNWFTVPFANAAERVSSQRWHRDPEEEHVVKVFVYFSDVDEDAGPFEYVSGSPSGLRHGKLWPWGPKHKHRFPPPEELEAAVPAEDWLTLTGPAGTMIFCDTGGFHRGGFARTKPRVLSISSYVRPEKLGKRRFRVDFEGSEDTLSPQARFALE